MISTGSGSSMSPSNLLWNSGSGLWGFNARNFNALQTFCSFGFGTSRGRRASPNLPFIGSLKSQSMRYAVLPRKACNSTDNSDCSLRQTSKIQCNLQPSLWEIHCIDQSFHCIQMIVWIKYFTSQSWKNYFRWNNLRLAVNREPEWEKGPLRANINDEKVISR